MVQSNRYKGFPGGSAGKESTCSVGDLGSIPGLGRSPGEEIGYSLQYSWTSLVAQTVKNPPAVWETWVRSLGWVGPPGEGHGNPLQYSCLENPHRQGSLEGYGPWGRKESDTTEQPSTAEPEVTKILYHKLGTYCLTVLEARSLSLRSGQGHAPLKA